MKGTVEWLTVQSQRPEPSTSVKPETLEFLNLHLSQLTSKISTIKERIETLEKQIENQFSDLKKVGYRLHSVFIHRGQATFGHYWIYIRDFKNKVYRMYNDQTIKEVPESEVFNDNEENTATPYFLVFLREDLTEQLSSAVVREVVEEDNENFSNEQLPKQTEETPSSLEQELISAPDHTVSSPALTTPPVVPVPPVPTYAEMAASKSSSTSEPK